jgi:DNA-binding CsgD family transcriptional regulator
VAAFLAAIGNVTPSSAAVEAVYRRSGGIPFVIEELVRCSGTDVCIDELYTAQLPWSLDEAVRQQLAGLAPDERRVMDALAVFGDPAPFDVLRVVCDLDDDQLLHALRSMVAQGIAVEPSDDTFWFTHALVADAVQQQLLGRERRQLHERSLAALRDLAAPDHAALARHALGAGKFDLIPAIAREGARRYLDRGASFQALRLAGVALAEAPNDPELLAVATDAAWRLEFGREAMDYARQWRDSAVTDLDRVESMRFIARLHHEMAAIDQREIALKELEQFADSLPTGGMARGRAAGAVAQLHMLAGHTEPAIAWADRAIADARRSGDEWLQAQASVERASVHKFDVSRDDAERALMEARDLAHQVGDAVLECRALNNLLGIVPPHTQRGEWARAELRETSARCGLDKLGAGMLAIWDADAALAAGNMPLMRQRIAEASQHWTSGTSEYSHHQSQIANLRVEEGMLADAMIASVHSCDSDRKGKPGGSGMARIKMVTAALENRRADAEAAFDELLAQPALPDSPWSLWFMIEIAMSALQAGVPTNRVREQFVNGWVSAQSGDDFVARHLEGVLLLADGDAVCAVAALEAVLESPDRALYVPTRGSLRTSLAAAQLAAGDRVAALASAKEAVADLATWPGWRRDRAEALVKRLEGSGARTDGELTPRELEVAALIAEGLTNSQLAERLYISPRTAAVHVSNILMKLGLSGRAEVAAWAVRHGVVLQPG